MLTVQSPTNERRNNSVMWLARCDCGRAVTVRAACLKRGSTRSCGCATRSMIAMRTTRHGMSRSPEYRTWSGMIDRCTNPRLRTWSAYGGRGIRVCDRWLKFENFFSDMGQRPSRKHSLDRVDNDGNYEPGNCRWATPDVQQNNHRGNVRLTVFGESMTIAQWLRRTGMPSRAVRLRLRMGWAPERALTQPVKKRRKPTKRSSQ